jgi:hypothetical protein
MDNDRTAEVHKLFQDNKNVLCIDDETGDDLLLIIDLNGLKQEESFSIPPKQNSDFIENLMTEK